MPRIRCTQRLLKALGKDAVRIAREDDSEPSDLDWYANLFYVEGRKCLIFVNAGTLYPVVALDVLKDDFRDPGELLRNRYRKLLRHLDTEEEEIEKELSLFGELPLGTTLDRSIRGFMADFVNGAKWFVDDEGLAHSSSEEISQMLAKTPIGRLETTYPQEELRKRVPSLRPVRRRAAMPHPVRVPAKALVDYLNRTEGKARSYHEILGYMYFLATSPEFTPPSVWMLSLLGGDEAFFEDKNEAAAVFGEMIKEYNRVAQDVEDGRGFDVDYVPIREKAMDNFADSAPLHQWSSGFALAYHARRGAWDEAWTEQADILNATLSMLMFFTSRNVAGLYLKHRGRTQAEMEKTAVEVCEEFSLAAELLATVGKQYREVPKPPKPTPSGDGAPGPSPKVGRNELCPCGSGKKYKHCCGRSGVREPAPSERA